MGTIKRNRIQATFGLLNVKRCFVCAMLSMTAFPLYLLVCFLSNADLVQLQLPFAFFSVFSGAFAYLLYQIAKKKARSSYELAMWMYTVFVHLYLSYLAGCMDSIFLYYAVVILWANLLLLDTVQYLAAAMMELLGCFWFLQENRVFRSTAGICLLAVVHLFAFFISRALYGERKRQLERRYEKKTNRENGYRDAMTGLFSRSGLEREVNAVWARCVAKREILGVFVIDIDHFESYNEHYGREAGDRCICCVAEQIKQTVGDEGITARIGGEEFLVFVRQRSRKAVYDLAQAVCEEVRNGAVSNGNGGITVSIGMDMAAADKELSLQGLCGRADRQMYAAKQEGGNRVRSTHMYR